MFPRPRQTVSGIAKNERNTLKELVNWSDQMYKRVSDKLQRIVNDDGATVKSPSLSQPSKFIGGTLRDYQLEGMTFLALLYENDMNGILADEMGLGKTIQTIAVLAHIMETHGDCGPHLVVCPLTVVENWMAELENWAPCMKCLKYHGTKEERKILRQHLVGDIRFNIVVTTYNMVLHPEDKRFLSKIHWSYLVVDEGHRLRNKNARTTNILANAYSSNHRIILTGTPLQNSLQEL
jgi:SNF2 family DNA or RNA helicase